MSNVKTITLTGEETEIEFGGQQFMAVWIHNLGSNTVYASIDPDISPEADGVVAIPSGTAAAVALPNFSQISKCYVFGNGKVQAYGTGSVDCPFKVAAEGGGSGGGGTIDVDSFLSKTSTNPAENRVITQALDKNLTDSKDYTDKKSEEVKKYADGLYDKDGYKLVDKLPETGDTHYIYLLRSDEILSGDDEFDIYLWIIDDTEEYFKKVGSTNINLVDYAKIVYVDEKYNALLQKLKDKLDSDAIADWAKSPEKPKYTASEVGADEAGSAEKALKSANKYTDSVISNENLLDNWYFADPINQRGENEYENLSNTGIYSIDRWLIIRSSASITDYGVEVKTKSISSTNSGALFFQRLNDVTPIIGKTVTLSVLFNGGDLAVLTAELPNKENYTSSGYIYNDNSTSIELRCETYLPYVAIRVSPVIDKKCNIIAVKLELGDTQTLARQDENGEWVLNDPPPNKALELVKCQRYQVVEDTVNSIIGIAIGRNATAAMCFVPTPTTLNATPTISFEDISLYGLNGLSVQESLNITSIGDVIRSENGIRFSAFASNLDSGSMYLIVCKTANSKFIIDANL